MLRIAALGLAAALVLSIGSTEDRRSAKDKYIAGMRGTVQEEGLARLLDDVVDFDHVGCQLPHLACPIDTRTNVGPAWLRAEDRLESEMSTVLRRLERVKPPSAVANEHDAFIAALQSCVARTPVLESEVPPVARWEDNIAAVEAFQRAVSDSVRCFPRLYEVDGDLAAKGHSFLRGPLASLVELYGDYSW